MGVAVAVFPRPRQSPNQAHQPCTRNVATGREPFLWGGTVWLPLATAEEVAQCLAIELLNAH